MSNEANFTSYTVPNGPFKDVTANPGEIFINTDDYSGREYTTWDTHARTRHFLEKFKPEDGWKVSVTQNYMGVSMYDAHTRDPQGQSLLQPAWMFTATLVDKENHSVANASVVQLLNCPMSIEMGQTRARGKLYQALGLPGSPNCEEERPRDAQPAVQPDLAQPMSVIRPVVDHARDAAAERAQQNEEASAPVPVEQPQAELADTVAIAASAVDASEVEDVVQEEAEETSNAEAEHDVDDSPDLDAVQVVPPTAPTAPTPAAVRAKAATKIPVGIMNQIKHRAARANVSVPSFNTVQEATDFLALLLNPKSGEDDLASGEQQ